MWDVVAAQLASMRAQVGALQAQVGGLQAQIDVMQAIVDEQLITRPDTVCLHEETEDDGSTLTEKRERCLRCGQVLVTAAV